MRVLFRRRDSVCIFLALYAVAVSGFAPPLQVALLKSPRGIAQRPLLSKKLVPLHNKNTTRRSRTILQMTSMTQGKRRFGASLAFLCGWADVALFTRYKTFATMMTGNTLWMMLGLAEQRYRDTVYYGSIILAYIFGLAVFRKVDLVVQKKSMSLSALVVATLFCVSEFIHFTANGAQWIPMLLLAAGYGVINAVGTEVAGTLTFVVTGHMTRLTNLLVTKLSSREAMTQSEVYTALENAAILVGFLGGALWAALFRGMLRSTKEFAVLGILHAIIFLSYDMEAIGGAWWIRRYFCEDVVDDDGSVCDLDEEEDACVETEVGGATNISSIGDVVSP